MMREGISTLGVPVIQGQKALTLGEHSPNDTVKLPVRRPGTVNFLLPYCSVWVNNLFGRERSPLWYRMDLIS